MAVMPQELDDRSFELTREQYEAILDQRARSWLGMSFEEFQRAHREGRLRYTPAVDQLLLLARARSS